MGKLWLHWNGNDNFMALLSERNVKGGKEGDIKVVILGVLFDRLFQNPETISYGAAAYPPSPHD